MTFTPANSSDVITIAPNRWSRVDLPTRLYYLQACQANLRRVSRFWVEEEAALRGHLPNSDEGAESWFLGPIPTARMLRYLINGVKSGGRPRVSSRRLRIDGRSVTRVFPHGFQEGLIYWDMEARVWSVGGKLQGANYRQARDSEPGPALILGASNVSSISITDLFSKLFCENRPAVCKLPTRLAPLKPIFEELLYPLIRDRHVQIITGDGDIGRELTEHPIFDTVHLTGSCDTYRRLREQNRYPERTFTAELGCVTPCLVVPGAWSQKELEYQARHLASLLVFNGGYNCVTPQVVVVAKDWPYKNMFYKALRSELEYHRDRDDIYPGAQERREQFRKLYPDRETFGPRTLVRLDPDTPTKLFEEESFCGMLGWVELDVQGPKEFLRRATTFCNEKLWGTLSCLLLMDTETRAIHERTVAQTLARLRYGTVGLNVYTGVAFASAVTPWGSYADGSSDTGKGWVHNTFFFDRPEKTVLEGSFVPSLPQPWIKPFSGLSKVGPALFELELEPNGVRFFRLQKTYLKTLLKMRHHQL